MQENTVMMRAQAFLKMFRKRKTKIDTSLDNGPSSTQNMRG